MAKDAEQSDEYEFLSIGRRQKSDDVKKALDRVKSMVRNPEARVQYMRLVMKNLNFKVVTTYFAGSYFVYTTVTGSFQKSMSVPLIISRVVLILLIIDTESRYHLFR